MKHHAAVINEMPQNDNAATNEAWMVWLREYNAFVLEWTSALVPPDIKRARDGVVDGLTAAGFVVPTN
jgi:hypothetical protein